MSEKKYKLLFVAEAMGGGVFSYLVELLNELAPYYDIYLAHGTRPQTPKDLNTYFDKRIKLIQVKNFTRSINPVKDLKAFLELRQIVRKLQPDCVHLHSSKAGVLGRWCINGRKRPVFYTPHGYSFLMSDQNPVKRTIYYLLELISAKRSCTTIACGEGEFKEALKLSSRSLCVNNGINIRKLEEVAREIPDETGKEFTVSTMGRICCQKNPELFNEIAENLPDVKFVWIGDGELRDVLVSPNIEITGWVDHEKALEKTRQSDVFLLPSKWEGLSIALLEAMYLKRVCIVSNVIGNHDAIKNGQNGYVCETVEEYAAAIRKIQKNDHTEMTETAFRDVCEIYNANSMSRQYSKIYREAINRNK